MDQAQQPSFLARNDFLIRRLHSLSGLIPVGAFMVLHLSTNASVFVGEETFQTNVDLIHRLGRLLPLVEWTFIFLPMIFHAVIGFVIIGGAMPNNNQYRYSANRRYMLQRATGMVAFVFILWHVLHMHGGSHNEAWLETMKNVDHAQFDPHRATSTAGMALQGPVVTILYIVGVLSCVYHLANGLWTMGITWGVWTSEKAQERASKVCVAFGVVLAAIAMTGLFSMKAAVDTKEKLEAVKATEEKMLEHRREAGLMDEEHGTDEEQDIEEQETETKSEVE